MIFFQIMQINLICIFGEIVDQLKIHILKILVFSNISDMHPLSHFSQCKFINQIPQWIIFNFQKLLFLHALLYESNHLLIMIRHPRGISKRGLPNSELIKQDPKGIRIDLKSIAKMLVSFFEHLRRHAVDRPNEAVCSPILPDLLRKAEVDNFNSPDAIDYNIGCFDVSIHVAHFE